MYWNSYSAEKTAGRRSIEKGELKATVDAEGVEVSEQQYVLKTKRWDANTGTISYDTQVISEAKLKANKADLEAKIAEIDAMLADLGKVK